jgi:hypothetical protein
MLQVFVEAVDAVDNGVSQWDGTGAPRYINNTTLGARVAALNPWQELRTRPSPDLSRQSIELY